MHGVLCSTLATGSLARGDGVNKEVMSCLMSGGNVPNSDEGARFVLGVPPSKLVGVSFAGSAA